MKGVFKNSVEKGTPEYMAPEIRSGDIFYNEKVDVYSFGVVLWSLVLGREPDYISTNSDLSPSEIIQWLEDTLEYNDSKYDVTELSDIIINCIHENHNKRPSFTELQMSVSSINIKKKG